MLPRRKRGSERTEDRPQVSKTWLENRKLEEEKVNDNQTGEQEKVDFSVVVTCHVPLSKSYTVSQMDFDDIFLFSVILLYFHWGKTEKMCNLIYNITIFMFWGFLFISANKLLVKILGDVCVEI